MSQEKAATVAAVESLIQYRFKNPALLWEALNTRPVVTPGLPIPPEGNKRLAVIGDTVLQLALAEDWYKGDTSRGHWASRVISKIGANANLDRQARAIGLERFISGPTGGKAVADTVEAILGAIYLDSSMERARAVVEALDLISDERWIQRELDDEGFVELSDEGNGEPIPSKRRKMDASSSNLTLNGDTVKMRRKYKRSLRLGHGRVNARLGMAYSMPPEMLTPAPTTDPAFAAGSDYVELSD